MTAPGPPGFEPSRAEVVRTIRGATLAVKRREAGPGPRWKETLRPQRTGGTPALRRGLRVGTAPLRGEKAGLSQAGQTRGWGKGTGKHGGTASWRCEEVALEAEG
ncbi:hypothetical protein P7K49_037175 [Saguinus oedipus]|uniref:Uncharacterized protein n=1 Tax=Saguinus oedipus TaxID=9490 RepID=A0ABQ9TIW3_SAGOE|nr:hypothetical protein P7K49_037175 [Saguinus oedipus]